MPTQSSTATAEKQYPTYSKQYSNLLKEELPRGPAAIAQASARHGSWDEPNLHAEGMDGTRTASRFQATKR